MEWFEVKSKISAKISLLTSLLFLDKAKIAQFFNDEAFFQQDGAELVRKCFYAVFGKNKEKEDMVPDIRYLTENLDGDNRFSWPEEKFFGNQLRYL